MVSDDIHPLADGIFNGEVQSLPLALALKIEVSRDWRDDEG